MPVQLGKSRKSPENTEMLPLDTRLPLILDVETNIACNQTDTDKAVSVDTFQKKARFKQLDSSM